MNNLNILAQDGNFLFMDLEGVLTELAMLNFREEVLTELATLNFRERVLTELATPNFLEVAALV